MIAYETIADVDMDAQVPLHCVTETSGRTHAAPVTGCTNVVPPSATSVASHGVGATVVSAVSKKSSLKKTANL